MYFISKKLVRALAVGGIFLFPTYATHTTTPYVWLDYLIWQAAEDQLAFAALLPGGFPPNTATAYQAILIEHPPKWDSGVRLGLGCSFCEDWDASAAFTYFKENSCTRITSTATNIVDTAPAGLNGIPAFFSSGATSIWKCSLNSVDINAGKLCASTECALIHPYLSLKWARINQSQQLCYSNASGIVGGENPIVPFTTSGVEKINRFSGTGPRMGVYASWLLGCHLSLFGDVSGALLYGKTCVNDNVNFTTATTIGNPGILLFDRKRNVRATAQMLLGVEGEWCIGRNYMLEVRVAYETQWWPTQWHVPVSLMSLSQSTGGDLTFHGFTLGIGARF